MRRRDEEGWIIQEAQSGLRARLLPAAAGVSRRGRRTETSAELGADKEAVGSDKEQHRELTSRVRLIMAGGVLDAIGQKGEHIN